jgi:hypothetical protein
VAGWIDKKIDAWIDRRIDKIVDDEMDKLLKDKMGEEDFAQLKKMTRKGQPLDAETEARLQGQLGDMFEPYKTLHNSVAKLERTEQTLNRIARHLP